MQGEGRIYVEWDFWSSIKKQHNAIIKTIPYKMNTYTNKVILLAGNLNQIDTAFVGRLLDAGAREVRILGGSETAMQALRDEMLSQKPDAIDRLRCFIGDMGESAYLRDAVMGADYVLCIPSIRPQFDCDADPASTCTLLLDGVTRVLHTATDCCVEKVVVVSPTRQEPLATLPDMLAALMETVAVAEGRYLGKESKTAIICARQDGDLSKLADYAFANASNADLLIQSKEKFERNPCKNFDFKRE